MSTITPIKPTQTTIPDINIFRYTGLETAPELTISNSKGILTVKDKLDTTALQTYNAALDVLKYYKDTFNRDSYDNQGAPVNIIVGFRQSDNLPMNNAFWNNEDKTLYFGDGDGKLFSPLGTALDVMAHEFGHAIIDSEVKLEYKGQSGGIHESVSDIFATGVDGNLKIGEDIFTPKVDGDSLRDLEHLHWTTKQSLPKLGEDNYNEPHIMSEPLSTAAVLASKYVGLDKIRKIWYTAISEDLKTHSGYTGFRQATESAALRIYGPEARQSIVDAWKAVGI